ncbi:MAG: alpha/beta hydrolase, partial [Lachnospiraceae bacterium]|nr:alpha/beta hydrolase [Lachnospiraceae bacterium]
MKTAIIIILIILLILCIIAMVQASIIAHGRRQTMDESWQWQQDNVEATHSFTRDMLRDYTVKGPKGVDIHVSVLPAKEESDKYMILAHGYTDTRYGMMKYVPHYYDLGFHCIMFDERGHGENVFEPCTYGVREVEYLLAVLRDTLERYGSGIKLGLHGESMGGGTVLYSL